MTAKRLKGKIMIFLAPKSPKYITFEGGKKESIFSKAILSYYFGLFWDEKGLQVYKIFCWLGRKNISGFNHKDIIYFLCDVMA